MTTAATPSGATIQPAQIYKGPANKLIAIEGIDSVGKNTQAKLLEAAIIREEGACGFFSFPRYETPTGRKVREYLDGKYDTLNLLACAKLYSDDRLAAREEILDLLFRGFNVVCDRYIDSNIAFQSCIAKRDQPNTNYSTSVRDYLFQLEYGINRLPQADITFVLHVDVQTSQRMMSERYENQESKKDKHEQDIALLELTHECYRTIAEIRIPNSNKQYVGIDCSTPDGGIRTREDIHQEIWNTYKAIVSGAVQPQTQPQQEPVTHHPV